MLLAPATKALHSIGTADIVGANARMKLSQEKEIVGHRYN